jgi:S1-C subfamily serine protease
MQERYVKRRRSRSFALLAVAVLVLAGCLPAPETQPTIPPPVPTPTPLPVTVDLEEAGGIIEGGPAEPDRDPNELFVVTFDAAEVVDRVMPAVVTVINEQQFDNGLFGRSEFEAGRGTGFIIDNEGHVVTNQHVVSGGTSFEVILANGETRDAELVGADPLSDLAVVRIAGDPPAVVEFGDSQTLRPGQPVLAIGSPLGAFTGTVTSGIVSALNRDFPGSPGGGGEGIYTDLIQHDAAINPGNSGGPLFDLTGRVIGVNTLGIPQAGTTPVQGIFFAIPANHVARVVGELIAEGRVSYPYMGIEYVQIAPDLAAANDLPIDYGALIRAVVPGGPADEGGIRPGDIILAIGDLRIDAQTTFAEALFARSPGETVPVTILRGGQQRTVEVTLVERNV